MLVWGHGAILMPLLNPTTVLAFQHYRTFLRRFASFPVTIEHVSRFRANFFNQERGDFECDVPAGVTVTEAYWFAWKAFHPEQPTAGAGKLEEIQKI